MSLNTEISSHLNEFKNQYASNLELLWQRDCTAKSTISTLSTWYTRYYNGNEENQCPVEMSLEFLLHWKKKKKVWITFHNGNVTTLQTFCNDPVLRNSSFFSILDSNCESEYVQYSLTFCWTRTRTPEVSISPPWRMPSSITYAQITTSCYNTTQTFAKPRIHSGFHIRITANSTINPYN